MWTQLVHSSYDVHMSRLPRTQRYRVLDPIVLSHMIEHPARGASWSLRELAPRVGVSKSTLAYIRSGERTVAPDVAQALAEAVGCHLCSLFAPVVSTDSDNSKEA